MSAAPPLGVRDADILDFTPARNTAGRVRVASRDLREAAALWRLCWTLAWLDIRLRYRGSMIGPFWLTLSTGIMVGSMAVIYGTLFHMSLHQYLPFLAVSQVLWAFLSVLASDACTGFTAAEGLIRAVRLPFTLHAVRVVLRNLVVLAHNLVVIVVVFAALRLWPGTRIVLVIPGFAIWLADALAITMLLGAVCARFRDIPPIVASIMQMAFFVTPVMWLPQQAGGYQWLLLFNPFYALLEIIRAPMLGSFPTATVYGVALGTSLLLWIASLLLFARVRGRIAFWV